MLKLGHWKVKAEIDSKSVPHYLLKLKTRACLLIFIILLHIQLLCFPAGQGLKKVILVLFERKIKFQMVLRKPVIKTSLAISF